MVPGPGSWLWPHRSSPSFVPIINKKPFRCRQMGGMQAGIAGSPGVTRDGKPSLNERAKKQERGGKHHMRY